MAALPGGIPGLAGRALERVAAGDWRPLVSTYPLAGAGRAHADLEGRRALGEGRPDRPAPMNSFAVSVQAGRIWLEREQEVRWQMTDVDRHGGCRAR